PCGNGDLTSAAQGIVYHTAGSGADWQQIGVAAGVVPIGITFTDSRHGFLSTASADGIGRLFASEDGGRSWRTIQLPPPPGGWPGPAGGADCGTATCVTLPAMFG